MKSYILVFLIPLIALFGSSCTETSPTNELTGTWSFKTVNGGYAELWVNDSNLAILKSPRKPVHIFSYQRNGDSIRIYEYGSDKDAFDGFVVNHWGRDTLVILQDDVENQLFRIDAKAPHVSNTEDFKTKMTTAFNNRLNDI